MQKEQDDFLEELFEAVTCGPGWYELVDNVDESVKGYDECHWSTPNGSLCYINLYCIQKHPLKEH